MRANAYATLILAALLIVAALLVAGLVQHTMQGVRIG